MSKKMTTQDIIDILEGKITPDTYPHYVNPYNILEVYYSMSKLQQTYEGGFECEKLERLYDFAIGMYER